MDDLEEFTERIFWTKELTIALNKMMTNMHDFETSDFDRACYQFDIAAKRIEKLTEPKGE